MRLSRHLGAATMLVAAAISSLSSCASTSSSGDAVARKGVQSLAEDLGAAMTPPVISSREADWLVAERVAPYDDPAGGIHVEALAWAGDSGSGDGAEIEVRITVDVDAYSSGTIGGQSYEAGTSTRCYRYGIIGYRFYDTLSLDETACDDRTAPPMPTPVPLPALPDDAQAVLFGVLAVATPGTVQSELRTAFPEDFITVESDSADGELVAAIGVPSEGECLVAVRSADDTVALAGFDPTWTLPGETGCSTALYTSPPL